MYLGSSLLCSSLFGVERVLQATEREIKPIQPQNLWPIICPAYKKIYITCGSSQSRSDLIGDPLIPNTAQVTKNQKLDSGEIWGKLKHYWKKINKMTSNDSLLYL